MGTLIDLTGKKFGRLTVIERAVENGPKGQPKWRCNCGCGSVCIVDGASLRNGVTKSCGCWRGCRPGMNVHRNIFADEEYNDGLYQDEILGKY